MQYNHAPAPEGDPLSLLFDPALAMSRFNISERELQRLAEFGVRYNKEINTFIDDFYVWMEALPEYKAFFTNASTVNRVKSQQIKYWEEFFLGKITGNYLKNRLHIGAVHADIGLPIHSYCAAMNFSSEWWKNKIEHFRLNNTLDSTQNINKYYN